MTLNTLAYQCLRLVLCLAMGSFSGMIYPKPADAVSRLFLQDTNSWYRFTCHGPLPGATDSRAILEQRPCATDIHFRLTSSCGFISQKLPPSPSPGPESNGNKLTFAIIVGAGNVPDNQEPRISFQFASSAKDYEFELYTDQFYQTLLRASAGHYTVAAALSPKFDQREYAELTADSDQVMASEKQLFAPEKYVVMGTIYGLNNHDSNLPNATVTVGSYQLALYPGSSLPQELKDDVFVILHFESADGKTDRIKIYGYRPHDAGQLAAINWVESGPLLPSDCRSSSQPVNLLSVSGLRASGPVQQSAPSRRLEPSPSDTSYLQSDGSTAMNRKRHNKKSDKKPTEAELVNVMAEFLKDKQGYNSRRAVFKNALAPRFGGTRFDSYGYGGLGDFCRRYGMPLALPWESSKQPISKRRLPNRVVIKNPSVVSRVRTP